MFGKKKDAAIKVMHYEGIQGFSANYPCTLEMKNDLLEVKRLKPETTVTLPVNRISSISAMQERDFMQKYKGTDQITAKGIAKCYLVVEYDNGRLVFWGTASEYRKFVDLQYSIAAPSKIEL